MCPPAVSAREARLLITDAWRCQAPKDLAPSSTHRGVRPGGSVPRCGRGDARSAGAQVGCSSPAFDAANGERRWFCPTPRLDSDQPVTTAGKTVFVTAHENQKGFYAIDAVRGRLLWNFTDSRETGVNDWQLAHDGSGYLAAHHYDRVYGFAVT